MSITGNKRRRIDCATINVGADATIGDDLYVGDNATVGGNLTVDGIITGGTITPSLVLPNGSASNPSLAFASDTKSGYYWDTVGTAGQAFAVAGIKKLKLDPGLGLVVNSDIQNPGWSVTTGDIKAVEGKIEDQLEVGTVQAGSVNFANQLTTTNGRIFAANGSASAPAVSFLSGTSSGSFWDPSGTAGPAWSAGGTKKMKLDPVSGLLLDCDIGNIGHAISTSALSTTSLTSTRYSVRVSMNSPQAVAMSTHTDIVWDTLDSSSNWSVTVPTATFTIPIDGRYLIIFNVLGSSGAGQKFVYVQINGGGRRWGDVTNIETTTQWGVSSSLIYPFVAGDTFKVRIFSGAAINVLGNSPAILSMMNVYRLSE